MIPKDVGFDRFHPSSSQASRATTMACTDAPQKLTGSYWDRSGTWFILAYWSLTGCLLGSDLWTLNFLESRRPRSLPPGALERSPASRRPRLIFNISEACDDFWPNSWSRQGSTRANQIDKLQIQLRKIHGVMPSSCHCLKQDLETHKPKKSEPKTHLATEKKMVSLFASPYDCCPAAPLATPCTI